MKAWKLGKEDYRAVLNSRKRHQTHKMAEARKVANDLIEAYKAKLYASHQETLRNASRTLQLLVNRSNMAKQITSLQQSVLKYEDPLAQEAALSTINLESIYSGVDAREKEPDNQKGLGYNDFIVLELLKWFKNDFFKWTNEPEATAAQGKPRLIGHERPNAEELKYQANVTEIYQCEDGSRIRFPRYNDPVKLLETRNGRCGEWNNCFCLCLRALGIRFRTVWNKEDHVWAEYYSEALKRWVHLDSCEEAFDNPTLYNKGWGKKMSYALAFGIDGCTDVSKRYVVEKDKALARDQIDENDLKNLLKVLTALQRRSKSKEELFKLAIEDNNEEMELRGQKPSYAGTLTLPRQSGSVEWTTARGEAGN